MAAHGDKCACGATLISSQFVSTVGEGGGKSSSSKPLPNIPYRLTLDIRLISLLACAALFLSSCATPLDKKDLEAFLSQREICDHLRGEIPDPSDPERLKEVIDDINKYCAGTDQQLKALKARYAKDPEVMATLNAFENRIESKPHQ